MGFQSYTRELGEAKYVAVQNAADCSRTNSLAKRVSDIIMASLALVFLSPVLLLLAITIRASDGGPAVFKHRRIGRNGQEFDCYKFRSMVRDADTRLKNLLENDSDARDEWMSTQKLETDPRITKFGKFLRRSSLDELPQLLNIIKGDMSIVGPRPIVRDEVEKYGEFFEHYCQVRPGLTGLWQVSGRSDTTYGERVALDVKYVTDWSYANDLRIIAKTIPAVLLSDGAR